ncbi:phosphate starvation protein PhoH [Candidatus Magnetomorum sp. HK-1]|nr:phosphate starvation protein PhoH [Candidatus Magnetomorum sp. HK-1]
MDHPFSLSGITLTEKPGQLILDFEDVQYLIQLFGENNRHLNILAQKLDVKINHRGNSVTIRGETVLSHLAANILQQLYTLLQMNYPIYPRDIDYAIRILSQDDTADLKKIFLESVYITTKKAPITPRSINQKDYIESIRTYDIVFGIGPAGTGKTYLAMAMAVSALCNNDIRRIVLTRPAVEAGESLGFLPGDLAEKVNPYLRPLYDALHDMMPYEKAAELMHKGAIEVAPLAFMRGRTLNDSFVILDEAQNTTSEQMKMFLTRMGYHSKLVITGDITQIDLPNNKASGLIEAITFLKHIKGICFVTFNKQDVVRHKLVSDIIEAYENQCDS